MSEIEFLYFRDLAPFQGRAMNATFINENLSKDEFPSSYLFEEFS